MILKSSVFVLLASCFSYLKIIIFILVWSPPRFPYHFLILSQFLPVGQDKIQGRWSPSPMLIFLEQSCSFRLGLTWHFLCLAALLFQKISRQVFWIIFHLEYFIHLFFLTLAYSKPTPYYHYFFSTIIYKPSTVQTPTHNITTVLLSSFRFTVFLLDWERFVHIFNM